MLNLKKYIQKIFFFPFVILFFIASALAQDNSDPFELDYMEEDIACEDLPEVFMNYDEDIQLDRQAVKSTLSQLSSFLQSAPDEEPFAHSELSKMIENIDNMIALINSKDLNLLTKSQDIHFFLIECLTPSNSEK